MIFERIESEGLAHYSYIVGNRNKAVVIDPRRDAQVYLDIANEAGMKITHVLETHRNEDYLIGSREIGAQTNAKILHSDYENYDFEYGSTIRDQDIINFGDLKIKAIHTPGHTLGHMSYLLYDDEDNPWIIFTGDTLFAGDVGRTDFYEGQKEEMTEKLYNSIFNKILPLGDGVIICPAHGAGSVCGSNITERIWTTIGLEKKHNPALQFDDKQLFIGDHAKDLDYPPYFKQMEKYNRIGPFVEKSLPDCPPLSPTEFKKIAEKAQIVDIRSETCFAGAHIPNSISLKENIIPNFAGWFLNYEDPILFLGGSEKIDTVVRFLFRQGFDNVAGYLKGGVTAYSKAGYKTGSITTINPSDAKNKINADKETFILEIGAGNSSIPSDLQMELPSVPDKLSQFPADKNIYVLCPSGIRSMSAASILKKNGLDNISVVRGGLSGWSKISELN